MHSWWLILLTVVVALMCLGFAVYALFYFISEEDSEGAYFTKIVIVLGILTPVGVVLLLPLDAANVHDPTVVKEYIGSLNTDLMWEIVLWTLLGLALIVVPSLLFFYEAFDPEENSIGRQIGHAIAYTAIICVVYVIIFAACFVNVGTADIPIEKYETEAQFVTLDKATFNRTSTTDYIELPVSLFTYNVGLMCLIGWVAFFFYGGTGLVALPIDFIRGFINRPQAMTASTFAKEMAIVAAKGDILLEMALGLQKSARGHISNTIRNKVNILRKETYLLEEEQENLIWAYTMVGGSPFIVYGKLAVGILGIILSLMWVVQILVANILKKSPFLNTMLLGMYNALPALGLVMYGIMVFYLVWITFVGQIRVGLRLVFFQIHPMKPHDTTLNSFLFNVSLMLLTCTAILQFATNSFNEYVPRTSINALMNLYVAHLKGIGLVIGWAQYCFLCMSAVSLVWVLICPMQDDKRRQARTIR
ncbi:putative LMBR1 like membrane protein [Trypanosoma vivax]|uniref:LMBR1-like membrane protein n=1 Tax=Trypanosoma vivax (strain Y486) TaxID=1055687 RepID=G0TSF7_TRYVY|nr:putative LMBR1 like membrane protein [Trypanosoma vivax]CCC46884.1 conserved hypothetical protein [Trypanosoma vivax Y486]